MKAYTDIEQSKKLAEILPIATADMWLAERYTGQVMANGQYIVEKNPVYYPSLTKPSNDNYSQDIVKDIPCWSLAALLKLIPDSIYENTNDFAQLEITKRSMGYHDINDNIVIGTLAGNLVDACVKIIFKLKEKNLL